MITETNQRAACKAAGDYGEESGIRGNLPGFGQAARKNFAGTAISIRRASFCNGFTLAKPPL